MKRYLSAMVALSLLFLVTVPAHAETESLNVTGKRIKIVGKSALYGFGGGLVVGLASQVFKKKAKNVFLFGSLGLYAGIILGVYVVTTSSGPAPYEGPDTYDDFSMNKSTAPGVIARNEARQPRADLKVNLLNLEF